MPPDQQNVVTPPADPAAGLTPQQAKVALGAKFSDPAWVQAQNREGTPQWHERQNFQAAIAGTSRAEWDHSRSTGATPTTNSVPQPSPATPQMREQVLPGAPVPQAQLDADQAGLADLYEQSLPASPHGYEDISFAGLPALSAEEQVQAKTALQKVGWAPQEVRQFKQLAVEPALRDVQGGRTIDGAYDAQAQRNLEKLWGKERTPRMIEFARAEAAHMRQEPVLAQLLDTINKGRYELAIRLLAERGERRAALAARGR